MKILSTLILMTALISSCSKNKDSIGSRMVETEVMLTPPAPVEENLMVGENSNDSDLKLKTVSDTTKKIIKTGEIVFETKDVRLTRKAIVSATKNLDGYIASETESGYEHDRKDHTLTLKVPAKNFDALLHAVSSAADRIDRKNIQIEDVTAEYIDTKSRLENKKRLERRYLELLNKASKITDMLAIENKLSEIRTEIESVEGQFLHMQKQVAYSSLTITFYSKSIVQETGKGFIYDLQRSLATGGEIVKTAFFGFISIWPVLLTGIVLFWWYQRRTKSKVVVKS